MTEHGLQCPACHAAAEPNDAALAPAGAMPVKLVLVLALLGVGVLASLATGGIISAALGIALGAGILAGNEGVRGFLVGLACIDLLWSGIVVALAISAMMDQAPGAGLVLALGAFAVAKSAFVIWSLRQQDVRDWMFRTAFRDAL